MYISYIEAARMSDKYVHVWTSAPDMCDLHRICGFESSCRRTLYEELSRLTETRLAGSK